MRLAIAEARKGVGFTRPNPPVGAVVIGDDGVVLGRGHHRKAGGPHAEVNAVAACGDADLSAATLYVTLEPCSTTGRTPPCTELVKARRFRRVVIGCEDPNPRHAGRGVEILRAAGIKVDVGVLGDECRELIAPFASTMLRHRPRVTLKLALTLDGKVADRTGASKWITGPASRAFVQRLRRGADAILVGSGTVVADDPELVCHIRGVKPTAWRVVADSRGRIPVSARLLTDAHAAQTVVATTAKGAARLLKTMPESAPATVWTIAGEGEHIGLCELLKRLTAELGVMELLCEGGGEIAGALLKEDLVDRLVLFYAPVVLGDARARPGFAGVDALLDGGRLHASAVRVRKFGDDAAVIIDLG